MLTELGRSQIQVQRCSLSSEGPRFRSSGAQCAQTLAVEVQQWPLRVEVGEELGEELARRKWTWKWRQRWWRRTRRRRRRRTTLIKSNNPHLAGGEKDSENSRNMPKSIHHSISLKFYIDQKLFDFNGTDYTYIYIYI